MPEKHLFDIPIYKSSQEEFLNKRNAILKKSEQSLIISENNTWVHNEIKAWLNVYLDGTKLKGILYKKKKGKFKKSLSKLFEINLFYKIKKNNKLELCKFLMKFIEDKFYQNYSKKRNYIYLDNFKNILLIIDI